jgi:asparagine synthetase B (glutamine-hydrolysing)
MGCTAHGGSSTIHRPCFPTQPNASWAAYAELTGCFAVARRVGDRVVLARDSLGLNKLYFAIHVHCGVVARNYLADLRDEGVPFEAIYAVPAGSMIEIVP